MAFQKKKFDIIPAIDLKGGKCVQLRQGKEEDVIFSANNPVEIAIKWVEEGARRLHIIDLDGAFQHSARNEPLIERIVRAEGVREKAKIQVGGGIRSYEKAAKFLNIGVSTIILGTAALETPELVKKLVKDFSPERIMIALDARGGRVAIKGWREITGLKVKDAARKVEEMGAGSILFTNIDVEGLMRGVNMDIIEEVTRSTSLPVIVSGGVSSIEDVRRIKEAGASGVVIGSALYMGKINLREAILKACEDSFYE